MARIELSEGDRRRLFKGVSGSLSADIEVRAGRGMQRMVREESHRRHREENPSRGETDRENRVAFGVGALVKLRGLLPKIDTKAKREGEKRATKRDKGPSKAARFIPGPSSNWTERG